MKRYYSVVFSYLSYCNMTWASTYESRVRSFVIQKRAIRIVAAVSPQVYTGSIFSNLKLLNLEQINMFQIEVFMYRYDRGLLPPAFRGYFKFGTEIHSHYTRNAKDCRSSYAHMNTRLFSIKHKGRPTSIWNKMPSNIRLALYLLKFEKLLKPP